jgi:hypothetical protein
MTDMLDAETCRHAARERFSSDACAQAYLALYERLVAHPDAPCMAPDATAARLMSTQRGPEHVRG